jgi:hypothetical protein
MLADGAVRRSPNCGDPVGLGFTLLHESGEVLGLGQRAYTITLPTHASMRPRFLRPLSASAASSSPVDASLGPAQLFKKFLERAQVLGNHD